MPIEHKGIKLGCKIICNTPSFIEGIKLGYTIICNTPSFIEGMRLGYTIICNIPSFIEGIKLGYTIIYNIPSFIEGIKLGYKIICNIAFFIKGCKIWGSNSLCVQGDQLRGWSKETVQSQVLHREPHPSSILGNLRNYFIKKELFYWKNQKCNNFMNII